MSFKLEIDHAREATVELILKIYGRSRVALNMRNTEPMRANGGCRRNSFKNKFTSGNLDLNGCQIKVL